jgi:pimeloyl-ACP methyl ester carboxylesterase
MTTHSAGSSEASDLHVLEAGEGTPVLLIHGGAEDADLLTPLGHALADRGHRAIWYDRRGTGTSTRRDWPGGGADQHADDAAALLRSRDAVPATVVGMSSGGVVALALAARHPDLVREVLAWEPAAVGVLEGGLEMHAEMMRPVRDHLSGLPADWSGAYRLLLQVISGGQADLESPEVARMSRNAEAMVRDDALLVRRGFAPAELPADRVRVAVGTDPDPLHASIAARLGELVGRPPEVVPGAHDHEVYLREPEVLAAFVAAGTSGTGRSSNTG